MKGTKWYPRGQKNFLQTVEATVPVVASRLALMCVGISIPASSRRVSSKNSRWLDVI